MPKDLDIKDSERDEERLQPEEATIDLPEVKDIPGQENIRPPRMKQMEDVTVSSGDEEGEGLLDDLNSEESEEEEEEEITDDADVTDVDKEMLSDAANLMPTEDETDLERARLDSTDEDGEPLEEETPDSGAGLDVPGAELDDADEDVGEEDEENNIYSPAQK